MLKWEYMTFSAKQKFSGTEFDINYKDSSKTVVQKDKSFERALVDVLNMAGEKGWEVLSIKQEEYAIIRCMLKRCIDQNS